MPLLRRSKEADAASDPVAGPRVPGAVVLYAVAVLVLPGVTPAQEEPVEADDIDEMVVTANRLETPLIEVASSLTLITDDEIESTQQTSVLELLRDVPALDVVQRGGAGRLTEIHIRGAEWRHTLVLVDGIEVNDPVHMGRAFNFAHLNTDNVERIEVIRGPQSVLYGSDAIGGVINIITKKGQQETEAFTSFEGGSFDTFRESAGASGGGETTSFSFVASRVDSEGISAASEEYGNSEKDGYASTSLAGRLAFTPTDEFAADLIVRYTDAAADIDDGGGPGGDDPNRSLLSRQLVVGAKARLSALDGRWDQRLGLSFTAHDREDNDDPDPVDTTELRRDSFEGRLAKLDWQSDFRLGESNTLTIGTEFENEKAETDDLDKSAHLAGVYVQDRIALAEALFATLGARVDDHEIFGSEATWRLTAAYLIGEARTKIRGTVGTGFKAPSLYQLYHPTYGDASLQPDESTGWDIGVEQRFLERKASLGATYFRNDFVNMVDYDFDTSSYKNIGRAESEGVELHARLLPSRALILGANYTYTEAVDQTTGEALRRRPRNKAGFDIGYRFVGKGSVRLDVSYVGEREDRGTLDAYTRVDLAVSCDLNERTRVFCRVENLFDKGYEEAAGYGAPGVAAYVGVKARF